MTITQPLRALRARIPSVRCVITATTMCLASSFAPSIASAQMAVQHLHDFAGSDGSHPIYPSTMMRAADGNYYGVAYQGGSAGYGVVYKMVITGTQLSPVVTYTVIHNFGDGSVTNDGHYPMGALVQDADGNLYGTCDLGGAYSHGTAFKLSLSGGVWTETILYHFGVTSSDGYSPQTALTLGDGTSGSVVLYGTTFTGGASNLGTIFKLAQSGSSWTKTSLHSFAGGTSGGSHPAADMILGSDGKLYGTAGVAFQQIIGGAYTTLSNFSTIGGGAVFCGVTQDPGAAVVVLYGCVSTESGGAIYNLVQSSSNPASFTLHLLYSFTGGSDGEEPTGNLLYSTDNGGSFYGVTSQGGTSGQGVLYNYAISGPTHYDTKASLTGYPEDGVIWGNIGGTSVLLGASSNGGANSLGFLWESYII